MSKYDPNVLRKSRRTASLRDCADVADENKGKQPQETANERNLTKIGVFWRKLGENWRFLAKTGCFRAVFSDVPDYCVCTTLNHNELRQFMISRVWLQADFQIFKYLFLIAF